MASGSPFQLIDVLTQHNVPVVIVGGHAVSFHGYVRATEDTDVVFLRSRESELALLAALKEIDACWISDEIDPRIGVEKAVPVDLSYIQSSRLMMLETKHGYLDVFDYVPGLPDCDVKSLLDSAVVSEGRRFVSIEILRQMKAASGRAKDLLDLENLE